MIVALLAEAGTTLKRLDAIILGNGPGSFIGMRIGASVAQGLSFGAGIDIVPISSLAVVAAEVFATSTAQTVAVAQDARMQEVYLARFRRSDNDLPLPCGEERIVSINDIVALNDLSLPDGKWALAGGGWDRCAEPDSAAADHVKANQAVCLPDARYLLPLGINAYVAGKGVAPEKLVPAYLRNKVAEVPVSHA